MSKIAVSYQSRFSEQFICHAELSANLSARAARLEFGLNAQGRGGEDAVPAVIMTTRVGLGALDSQEFGLGYAFAATV